LRLAQELDVQDAMGEFLEQYPNKYEQSLLFSQSVPGF